MSFPPHSKYKVTELDWLPQVPDHWRVVPLKYAAAMKGRLGWQGLRADEYTETGPYLVTSEHITNDRIDWQRCYHVPDDRYDLAPEIQLRPHDLVMMKDGAAMGKLAYVDHLPGPACLNSHLLLFRPREDCFRNRFLYYVLSSPSFRAFLLQECKGTTFFGISQESMGSFPFIMPPLPEQIAIADFLDRETGKIDALVEEQRRLIELLKEKRQAIISHTVTKGLNPDAPMKDTGIEWLGEVPEHWIIGKLGRFCKKIGSGKTPSGGAAVYSEAGVLFLRSQNVYDDGLRLEDAVYIDEEIDASMAGTRVFAGDILLNITGASLGRTALVPDVFTAANVNQHVCIIRLHDHDYRAFLSIFLKSQCAKLQFDLAQSGAAREGLNFESIGRLTVLLPPTNEQNEIVQHLDHAISEIDELVEEAKRAINVLLERRVGLVSEAVTGKIDVLDRSTSTVVTPDFRQSRKLVAAKIVEDLSGQKTFGRVKLQKLLYLAEAHGGIHELRGHYVREAAGPLDREMVWEVETALQASGHVVVEQPEGRGTAVNYQLRGIRGTFQTELEALLGDRVSDLSELIETVGALDTRGAEAVATLYAAWNDALASGTVLSDDEIIWEVLNEWHPKKAETFTAADLKHWLAWMRRNGLEPKGSAPVTSTGRLFV